MQSVSLCQKHATISPIVKMGLMKKDVLQLRLQPQEHHANRMSSRATTALASNLVLYATISTIALWEKMRAPFALQNPQRRFQIAKKANSIAVMEHASQFRSFATIAHIAPVVKMKVISAQSTLL